MRAVLIPLLVLALMFTFAGCSKDEKEVSDMEREITEAEPSMQQEDTEQMETAPAEEDTSFDYASTPDEVPQEKPKRESVSMKPDMTGYAIQVGAGTNLEYARDLVEKFELRGYDAFLTEAIVDDQTFYRIRIGVFADYQDAKQTGLEIKDKYSVDFWIDQN